MKILTMALVLILVIPSVSAVSYKPSCNDTDTLIWQTYINRSINGNVTEINSSHYEECDYGCDPVLNVCAPPPFLRQAQALAIIFFIFGAYILIRRIR